MVIYCSAINIVLKHYYLNHICYDINVFSPLKYVADTILITINYAVSYITRNICIIQNLRAKNLASYIISFQY